MSVTAIFDLGELLIESGKTATLGALIALEPSILPALQGGASLGNILDKFASLPAATEEAEIKAAQTILGDLGALIESPQYKTRAIAALKGLLS